MDTITHILFGIALARSELVPEARSAEAIVILGSIIPDIDLVFRVKGINQYFIHHRKESHSLLGLFFLSLPLWLFGILIFPEVGRGWLYLLVWMGLFSHILLDYLTIYGVDWFYPFRNSFYNFGIIPIFDPWLDILLLPPVLEKFIPLSQPFLSRISLLLCLGYFGLLASFKFIAIFQIKEFFSKSPEKVMAKEIRAYPYFLNPFQWLVLAKTDGIVYRIKHSLISGPGPVGRFNNKVLSQLDTIRDKSQLLKAFLVFTDFQNWESTETEQGIKVVGNDLRFSHYGKGFRAEFGLSQNGQLISEKFSYY